MSRDSRHDNLFEPVAIGPVMTRNRFFNVRRCAGPGVDSSDTWRRHREIKALGGWGVVQTEESTSDCCATPNAGLPEIIVWCGRRRRLACLCLGSTHAYPVVTHDHYI